jgi:RNA polymerase sigma factor (sigma-70 family)
LEIGESWRERAKDVSEGFESDERRELDDDELVARVRDGDNVAFDELYRRHSLTARRTARWMTHSDHVADDVVADVFAGMLSALRNGRGPHGNFTAYLKASVRNRCIAHRKAAIRATPTDDEEFDGRAAEGSATDSSATSQIVATAFAALTPRWQRTLWMSEVEGRSAKDIATELNLPVAAVPALAYRARRAFAEAYLQQHAENTSDAACKALADKLPRYVRGSASRRDMLKVDVHLEHCHQCKRTVAEMSDLNMSLRTLPAPPVAALVAGAGGLATWLATAAAIGAVVVVPAIALRSDEAPNTASAADDTSVTAPAGAGPLDPDGPITLPGDLGDTAARSVDSTAGTAAPITGEITDTTLVADPGAIVPAGNLPLVGDADGGSGSGAPQDGPTLDLPGGVPSPTLPVSPTTIPDAPAIDPLLPEITVPVTVPLPLVPIDASVGASGDGVAVDANVGLPAGLGGVEADVSAGGGGVQATVVLPTLPLLGTVPPVVADVPLPPPVAELVDDLLDDLLGAP